MSKEVRFNVTEGPGFLPQMGIELEEGGTIAIIAYNRKGECYAFSRISRRDFRAAVDLLCGEGDGETDTAD